MPAFNSLSRDHTIAAKAIHFAVTNPLSTPSLGITAASSTSFSFSSASFQLPLSGSHDNVLHHLHRKIVASEDFQLPLSGSRNALSNPVHEPAEPAPFNSLSRDHMSVTARPNRPAYYAFNSLSRDHLVEKMGVASSEVGVYALSTPSLGITEKVCGCDNGRGH